MVEKYKDFFSKCHIFACTGDGNSTCPLNSNKGWKVIMEDIKSIRSKQLWKKAGRVKYGSEGLSVFGLCLNINISFNNKSLSLYTSYGSSR